MPKYALAWPTRSFPFCTGHHVGIECDETSQVNHIDICIIQRQISKPERPIIGRGERFRLLENPIAPRVTMIEKTGTAKV
jgi:hypothetical protein